MSMYELWKEISKTIEPKHAKQVDYALANSNNKPMVLMFDASSNEYHLFFFHYSKTEKQTIHKIIGNLKSANTFFKELYGDDCDFDGTDNYFAAYHQYQHNIAYRAVEDKYVYKIKPPQMVV